MQHEITVPVKRDTSSALLSQLARHLGITVEKDCQQEKISLPAGMVTEGEIYAYSPGTGIDAFIVDATFTSPFELHLSGDFPAPLTFFTQASGTTEVTTGSRQFSVASLQCSIYAGFTEDQHVYRFSAKKRTTVMITMVHKSHFFKNIGCDVLDVPGPLLSTIESMTNRDDEFLYQDIFHLPAIDALHEIIQQEHIGLLNSSFATAKIYEVLFLQLKQYKIAEAHNRNRHKVRELNKLSIIQSAEQVLMSHLMDPPTIPELARMVGTNQQDLKNGFRQVYGTTINQYLTDRRLEQAGILMSGGEMSVAEIAQAVGYNSPGYFSRRFKEKYGMGPRMFTKKSQGS